jgi:hypothetical protein
MTARTLKIIRLVWIYVAICCLFLLCRRSEAQDKQAAPPRIDISMTPEHVVLGESDTAEVLVHVANELGPVECEAIRIHVNTGGISELSQIGPGRYASTYTMPADYFPRFALIAAVGTCAGTPVEGYTVLPLFGTGEVEVKSQPRSQVTLKIADRVFGPKKTNAWGRVRIPIVVPPGHFVGIAGDKTVDLKLPPVNRIVAIADRLEIKAGDEGRTIVWVFAIDSKGNPLEHGAISIQSTKGTTTPTERVDPGVYRSYYTGPTQIGDQQGVITVAIDGDAASKDTVRFAFSPGAPADIRIRPRLPRYRAGSETPVPIDVAVVDQYGNPTGNDVSLTADFGVLSPIVAGDHGTFSSSIALQNHFEGRNAVTLSAKDRDGYNLNVSTKLPLQSGDPKRITIVEPSAPVPADGLSTVGIDVRVLDEYDNPVPEVALTLKASAGRVPPSIVTDYETQIPFTPPIKKGTGVSRVHASLGDLSASATVKLSNRLYLLAVTPRLGFISNFGNLTTYHLAVTVEQSLWFLLPGLHVDFEFGHYYSSADMKEENVESSFHAFPLYGLLGYQIRPIPKLFISPNVGVGVHIIRNKIVRPGVWESVEKGGQLGIQGSLEAGYLLGPGKLTLRVGYLYAKSGNINLLTGRIGGLSTTLGYRWELR